MEDLDQIRRKKSAPTSVTPSKASPQKSRRKSLAIGLASHRKSQCDILFHLEPATKEQESKRPGLDDGKPTDIFFFILFKKIRNVDVMKACVSVRFILSMQWEAPHLKGKRVDLKNIWTPKIDFLNNDMLVQQSADPTFFPEFGEVKQITVMDGNMSNEMDLKYFPWDFDDVNLLMAIEMDTFDRNVRLFWQESRDIKSVTPDFLDRQLTEVCQSCLSFFLFFVFILFFAT
jgi:hypothetical protein